MNYGFFPFELQSTIQLGAEEERRHSGFTVDGTPWTQMVGNNWADELQKILSLSPLASFLQLAGTDDDQMQCCSLQKNWICIKGEPLEQQHTGGRKKKRHQIEAKKQQHRKEKKKKEVEKYCDTQYFILLLPT